MPPAYKVRVEEITPDTTTDTHVMRIQSVIKEGGRLSQNKKGEKKHYLFFFSPLDLVWILLVCFQRCLFDLNSISITGTVDSDSLGKLRKFITFPFCRSSLDLRIGKTYLIMGTGRDVSVGANAQT